MTISFHCGTSIILSAKFFREYLFPDGESVVVADAGLIAVDVGVAKN